MEQDDVRGWGGRYRAQANRGIGFLSETKGEGKVDKTRG